MSKGGGNAIVRGMLYLEGIRCIGHKWPTVSGGRWSFRPRLKRPIINKLIIKFDDWSFEPRPKRPAAI